VEEVAQDDRAFKRRRRRGTRSRGRGRSIDQVVERDIAFLHQRPADVTDARLPMQRPTGIQQTTCVRVAWSVTR
jgi:hypothetical protein